MKLSIGTVSRIFDISKDTLRYYDKIGILKPEVNKENGYRYYDFRHIEQLGLILGIKYLGISLADIRGTIESGDIEEYKNIVIRQEDIVDRKIKELKVLEKGLKEVRKIIDKIINFKNEEDFSKLEKEEVDYILYGVDVKKLLVDTTEGTKEQVDEEGFIYVYDIVNNEKVIENESVMFIRESEGNNIIIKEHEAVEKKINGKLVTAYFYGTVNEMNDYILKLNKYFKCNADNEVYLNYKFYIPQKTEDEYFVKIKLKI